MSSKEKACEMNSVFGGVAVSLHHPLAQPLYGYHVKMSLTLAATDLISHWPEVVPGKLWPQVKITAGSLLALMMVCIL